MGEEAGRQDPVVISNVPPALPTDPTEPITEHLGTAVVKGQREGGRPARGEQAWECRKNQSQRPGGGIQDVLLWLSPGV